MNETGNSKSHGFGTRALRPPLPYDTVPEPCIAAEREEGILSELCELADAMSKLEDTLVKLSDKLRPVSIAQENLASLAFEGKDAPKPDRQRSDVDHKIHIASVRVYRAIEIIDANMIAIKL